MRHLAALALSLGLLLTVVPTALAITAQYDPHYNDYCNAGGLTTEPYGYTISRSSAQTGPITGARGRFIARALWPCVNGDDTYTSKSLILPANLQGKGSNGTYNFVQAGMGKVNNSGGATQCSGSLAMQSDQTYFVYTPSATSNGVYCRAEFVDFNNDGTPDNPVAGVTYDVTITEYNHTFNYWRVCFTRVSDGASDCKNIARTSSDGGLFGSVAYWAGCEVGNLNNALGVPANQAYPTMSQMGYRRTDGTWYYTENDTPNPSWRAVPSYYDWVMSQTGLGEQFSCSTASH